MKKSIQALIMAACWRGRWYLPLVKKSSVSGAALLLILLPFNYVESATEFPSVPLRVSQRRPRYDSASPYEFRSVRIRSARIWVQS